MTREPGFLEENDLSSLHGAEEATSPSARNDSVRSGPILFEADAAAPQGRLAFDALPSRTIGLHDVKSPASIKWIMTGVGILIIGWLSLSLLTFIIDEFKRSKELGFISTTVFAAAASFILTGISLELRGFLRLKEVSKLRNELTKSDLSAESATNLLRQWIPMISNSLPNTNEILSGLSLRTSTPEIISYAIQNIELPLRSLADEAGTRAAIRSAAIIAILPSKELESIALVFTGISLIREISRLFGFRPSFLVTVSLFRRLSVTAISVVGVDLLSQTIADTFLKKVPFISHLADIVPGFGLAALRTLRLAKLSAAACSPLAKV